MSVASSSRTAEGDERKQCAFCPKRVREPYECPRCNALYCSLRCYKSEAHIKCSEDFYRERVKQHLEGKRFTGDSRGVETFEDHMRKQEDESPSDLLGPPGPQSKEEEEGGELLDSDDEGVDEDDYIKKVLKDTVDGYCQDEADIERQLLALGVGSDVDALLNAMSEEEKLAFQELADQIDYNQSGIDRSVFRGRLKDEEDSD